MFNVDEALVCCKVSSLYSRDPRPKSMRSGCDDYSTSCMVFSRSYF